MECHDIIQQHFWTTCGSYSASAKGQPTIFDLFHHCVSGSLDASC